MTGHYDAQVAAGSLIWNLGQAEAFRQSMELVGWELSSTSMKKLEYQSKRLKTKAETNLKTKPIMRAQRIAKQNQYTDTSKYRTSAQQAKEYAKTTPAIKKLPSTKVTPVRKSLRRTSKK